MYFAARNVVSRKGVFPCVFGTCYKGRVDARRVNVSRCRALACPGSGLAKNQSCVKLDTQTG